MARKEDQKDTDDDLILRNMLDLATTLCEGEDAFLSGQYDYLRQRIDALIEIRRARYAS
ncbi:hypothetical protein ABFZ85_12310 [Hyphococcus formosus]|uniref:hypothetical protein n=1 Tax=Hyphococcus formosus TaxID=3143534 RepID=UPI00398A6F57